VLNKHYVEATKINYLFLHFTIYKILIPNACKQQICVVLIILIKRNKYGISIFKSILFRYKCILRLLINVELLSNMIAITFNK